MQPWQILLGLLAGALGIGALAASNAKAAEIAQANADDALLNRAVSAALAREQDLNVLTFFATKLRAAGYTSYADSLLAKSAMLQPRATQGPAFTIESWLAAQSSS